MYYIMIVILIIVDTLRDTEMIDVGEPKRTLLHLWALFFFIKIILRKYILSIGTSKADSGLTSMIVTLKLIHLLIPMVLGSVGITGAFPG